MKIGFQAPLQDLLPIGDGHTAHPTLHGLYATSPYTQLSWLKECGERVLRS